MFKNNRFDGRGASRHSGRNAAFGGRPSFNRGGGNRRARFMPKALDPRLFVREAIESTPEEQIIEHKFSDFAMDVQLKANLEAKGFKEPTPIQDKALGVALEGKDVIGLADTGTGKTLTFVLPILNKILNEDDQTALIMAPTRELAVQIRDEMRSLIGNLPIYSTLLIGGSDIRRQIMDIKRRPHIYVGTPGRIKDLYNRGVLRFKDTNTVVLDEMDRMLDMGFMKEIVEILSYLPDTKQSLLFSATMNDTVEKIASQFMSQPVKISVKSGATSQNVDQNVIRASGKANKVKVLHDLLIQDHFSKVIIFGRTKHGVEELSLELIDRGFKAGAIHGDKRQSQREQVLRAFKSNNIKILIATDVAARGIDVKDISHVINFDQPATYDDYIHRVGRTGRAGKKGYAITFID